MKKRILSNLVIGLAFFASNASYSQITTFNYTGSIDEYIVPAGITSISIQAYGAQGGNDNGGLGAGIYGEFNVAPGDVLKLVVGQQGIVNNCGGPDASGGGGGGSFVWDPMDVTLPLVAAGAGGGGNENWGGLVCRDGIDGQATADGTSGSEGLAAGGTGGNGGAGDAPSGTGSGGGGWLSAGENSTWGDGCTGGTTLPLFVGGLGSSGFGPGGEGGFGGGGGAVCGCGGGSGYSGGAGGNGSSCRAGGGGGGSYNQGTEQDNQTGVHSGNGQIIITVLCSPITVTVSDYSICLGESITVNGTGLGTITWDAGIINGVAFTPVAAGVITYTATSDTDADCDVDIEIAVLELPLATYTTTDEIGGADGEIDITVTGGTPAYTFDWDNDGTGDFDDTEDLTGLVAGTYIVVVKDDSSCTSTEMIVVNSQVGIEENTETSVSVYPNPTAKVITISNQGDFSYKLLSVNGQILSQGYSYDSKLITLEPFAKGVYILEVVSNNETTLLRVIKK